MSYVPFEEGSRDDYLGSEDIHIIFVYISLTRIQSTDPDMIAKESGKLSIYIEQIYEDLQDLL